MTTRDGRFRVVEAPLRRLRRWTPALCAFLALGAAASAGERPADDAPWRPAAGEDGSPLRPLWRSPLGDAVGASMFLAPPGYGRTAKTDSRSADAVWSYVFVVTRDHRLACIDGASGDMVWWSTLPGEMLGRPAFSPNGMYLIARQQLMGIDVHTGRTLFRVPLAFAPAAAPGVLVGGGVRDADAKDAINPFPDGLLIPGLDNLMRRVDVLSAVWPPEITSQFRTVSSDIRLNEIHLAVRWAVRMGRQGMAVGAVLVSPDNESFQLAVSAPARNLAYLCAWDLDNQPAAGGNRRGENVSAAVQRSFLPDEMKPVLAQRPLFAAPIQAEGTTLMPGGDGVLYAVSATTNTLAWRHAAGDTLFVSPQYLEDLEVNPPLVLQRVGEKRGIVALLHETGKLQWSFRPGRTAVARIADPDEAPVDRTMVVVQNGDGSLSGLRLSNGQELWRVPFAADAVFGPNTRESLAYVFADGGKTVMALERTP